eukprot:2248429-Amphidinium_carterae.1
MKRDRVARGCGVALYLPFVRGGVTHHDSANTDKARKHFRGHQKLAREDPSGYGGGVGAAEEMLSNMVTESEMNLDAEMERCASAQGLEAKKRT